MGGGLTATRLAAKYKAIKVNYDFTINTKAFSKAEN